MFSPIAVLVVVGAYLLGAVPFGLLLGRSAGVDVRAAGSGNIGATNVARTAGRTVGLLTLLLDAVKGALPPLVAKFALGLPVEVQVAAGFAAVLGHVFPVYLGFRGGKGVATGAGVFAAVTPYAALVSFAAFAVVYAVAKVVSVGSLVASVSLVAAAWWLDGRVPVVVLAAMVTVIIFVRHVGNLRRLWRGRELGV